MVKPTCGVCRSPLVLDAEIRCPVEVFCPQPSIWSLQPHLSNPDVAMLSLFYIGANGMMLFSLANPKQCSHSGSLLARLLSISVYCMPLNVCMLGINLEKLAFSTICHRYFESTYISYNLTYMPNAWARQGRHQATKVLYSVCSI